MNTIIHAIARTIIILTAVAGLESISLIQIFARIDINPANTAERTANKSHVSHNSRYLTS